MTLDESDSQETGHTIRVQGGLVVVTLTGPQSAPSVMAAQTAIVQHPDYVPGMDTLWDVRGTYPDGLDMIGTKRIGDHGAEVDKIRGFHRTAVVTDRPIQYGISRMYEMVAQRPTHEVRVFENFDDAIAWLRPTS